jgi:membrane protease YdiL (CAAX protease family)
LKPSLFFYLELIVLALLPWLLFYEVDRLRFFIPILWTAGLISFYFWRRSRGARGDLWGLKSVHWGELSHLLMRFVLVTAFVVTLTLIYYPEALWSLLKRDLRLWLLIMVLYPVLSVLPQELIYRGFLFERYGARLSGVIWILFSATAFALAHLFLRNLLAPAMCFAGGLLLARTYQRTQSLSLVVLEHALYGDLVFTIGLGQYFYHGRHLAGH